MKTTWKSKEKILMLAVICWSLLFSPSYAAEYEYIELKPPLGWNVINPLVINDNGVVVGYIESNMPYRHGLVSAKAFIYNKGFYTYLLPPMPPVGGIEAKAVAINNAGTVIGLAEVWSLIPSYSPRIQKGFIYRLGICTKLSPLRFRKIKPVDINDNGEVVGTADDQGFIYRNGMYTMLLPPGWTTSDALKINNNGVVLGLVPGQGSPLKGFIYNDGTYIELLPPGWSSVNAVWDINNNGEVIGYGFTGQGIMRSFLYSDGGYTELLPPGSIRAYAYKINNNGVVIGDGVYDNNLDKGFIYKEGKYTELLPPGTVESGAGDINDKEEVVCVGSDTVSSGWSSGFVYKDGEYTELLLPGYQNVRPYKINNSGMVLLSADEINPSSVNKYFLAEPK
jgi:probable HAF family extracellular repeat protein